MAAQTKKEADPKVRQQVSIDKREQTYQRAEANPPQNQLWPKDFIPGPTIGECIDAYHAGTVTGARHPGTT